MSDLPPNIDAILSSIRSRMNEEVAPPAELVPPPAAAPAVEAGHVGSIVIGESMTLEALMRAMLEPMLKSWLDAHMPEIVERMAQNEIKRLTGRD